MNDFNQDYYNLAVKGHKKYYLTKGKFFFAILTTKKEDGSTNFVHSINLHHRVPGIIPLGLQLIN